jgi:hypothetical protein
MRDLQKVTTLFTRNFLFIFKTLEVYYYSTYSPCFSIYKRFKGISKKAYGHLQSFTRHRFSLVIICESSVSVPPLGVKTHKNQKQAGLHYTLDGQELLNSVFKGGHYMSSSMRA